jgi:hypothetical protein
MVFLVEPLRERQYPSMELDPQALRAYVLGSLHVRGSAHADFALRVRRALKWYREVVGRGARPVLFSLVFDLGFLLLEADGFPFRSLVDLASWPADERETRLAYESRFLNTLLHDPSVRRATEAIAKDSSRDDLIARAISIVLRPLLETEPAPGAPTLNPVLLRELAPRGHVEPEEDARRWTEVVGSGANHVRELASSLERILASLGDRPAFAADDLAEIEHWSAYKRAAQRLAGRRVAARAAALPPFDPRRARVHEDAEQETELPDAGYYPEGGFSELATKGTLENLVPSELLYLGEEAFASRTAPDLFAVRYLEHEALFYKRDSGQLQRVRRTVHLAVAPDQGFRLKLPWHPDALAQVIYGLFVRLVEDLDHVFPRDALRVEIHLVADEVQTERAREDQELLRVLLRHEVARGTAAVTVDGRGLDLRALGERTRRVYGIAVQSGDLAPAGLPGGTAPVLPPGAPAPRLAVLKLGGAPPPERVARSDRRGENAPPTIFVATHGPLEEPLVRARDELVAEITGTRAIVSG